MNAPHSPGRHRTRPRAPRSSAWQRFRRTMTAGVFLAATVAGVGVGLQGAQVSPVAPATPSTVDAAAAAPSVALGDGARSVRADNLRSAGGPRPRGHGR